MNKKSKVILLPCNSYREASVYEALKKGMKLLDIREILPDQNEKNTFETQSSEKSGSGPCCDHTSRGGGNVCQDPERRRVTGT